jgi:SAM-dependent methyltransferase
LIGEFTFFAMVAELIFNKFFLKVSLDYQGMLYKETTRLSYEATASTYAENVSALAPIESIEKLISVLIPTPRILDIGCGSGRDAKIFQSMGAEVIGIDFCASLLEIAKAHAPSVDFQLMDIEELDFPEETFDAVWAASSLLHLPKSVLPHVLARIHAILEEDGYFYLTLKKGSGEQLEVDERYEDAKQKFWAYYEADEIKKLLTEAQFAVLACDLIEKNHPYHSHAAYRLFCRKK